MIKRYCDICSTEMLLSDTQPQFLLDRLEVKITRAVDGSWNGGDACVNCVRRAVLNGEPIEEPPF